MYIEIYQVCIFKDILENFFIVINFNIYLFIIINLYKFVET